MAEQVGKIWILRGFREVGYALSPEARAAQFAQVEAALNECGRLVVSAAARWSNSGVHSFGAELFPDLESLRAHTAMLHKLDWFRYVDSESFVGTPTEINEPAYENPVFQLQLIRGLRDAVWSHSAEEIQAAQQRNGAMAASLGVRRILRLDCRWAREDYMMVQILEWPSLEAVMKHSVLEEESEWPRYLDQTHILGVKAA
jgi:hypothetical protein